jgi:hypothetical protein
MVSEDDRKTFDMHKAPSLTSRLVVAHRVVSIFQDMMPNLKAKILSPQEIKMIYGPSFENKKGFIIDGTIVLKPTGLILQCFMNLDIIMLGGFLSIIQEHMLLLWRMYRIHTRVFLGTALCTIPQA